MQFNEIPEDYKCIYPKKRACFAALSEYINCDSLKVPRICALYGLRRTGKTVLMQQCMEALTSEQKKEALYISCDEETSFHKLINELDVYQKKGYKYFFIDEITYTDKFQIIGEVLANILVGFRHARVVVSGTDSLGLSLPSHDLQYDRTFFIHTTHISYAEYKYITDCSNIDDYIKNGGVLSVNEFSDYHSTHEYIETAISKNLINSLKRSEGLRTLNPPLSELYENSELRNVVERIVNGYSQNLTLKAIKKEFKASLISTGINNLSHRDMSFPENALKIEQVNEIIAAALDIKNTKDIKISLTEEHKKAVYDFLWEMDVFLRLPLLRAVQNTNDKLETVSHPGLCHANIKHSLDALHNSNNWLEGITQETKDKLMQCAYQTAFDFLLENIILTDVYYSLCKDNISKERWFISKFDTIVDGVRREVDMIILDKSYNEIYLYEIKHSNKNVKEQSKHLENENLQKYIEENFGNICGSYVLYTGETDTSSAIPRVSVETFLKALYAQETFDNDFNMGELMQKILDGWPHQGG